MFIIFWDFLMAEQFFFSPQVKRSLIISNKLVYKSRLTSCWMVTKYQENLKTSDKYLLFLSPLAEIKISSVLAKISWKKKKLSFSSSALFHIKTALCLKDFVNDCVWKQPLAFNSSQTPSNFIRLTIFVPLRSFTQL